MKRTIKFRAKRKDNGQWVECESLIQGVIDGRKFVQLEHTDSNEFRQYEVDPSTISQYTGRDDDFGTPIYEGDIVDNDLGQPTLVKWYVMDDQQGYWLNLDNSLKVVGNKWDNPDMTYDEFIDKYNPKL